MGKDCCRQITMAAAGTRICVLEVEVRPPRQPPARLLVVVVPLIFVTPTLMILVLTIVYLILVTPIAVFMPCCLRIGIFPLIMRVLLFIP